MKKALILILVLATVTFGCKTSKVNEGNLAPSKVDYGIVKNVFADKAGIATAHPAATKIGLDIMKKGGNAVDAAIATQFALAVCYPVAGNIGGGGFMVIRMENGQADALDFREKAPSSAHRDMYLDEKGDVISGLSINGHLASGVPGSVDGMVKAFEKYSKLKDWAALIQPSIDLAKNGVVLTPKEAKGLNNYKDRFINLNTRPTRFVNENGWNEGDLLIQPELAKVLTAIRDKGRLGFYDGWVADSIVSEMQRGGGIISHQDLLDYHSAWRKPLMGEYRGHKIISMPPSSSGGIALQQLLSSIEPFPMSRYGFQSTEAVHLMVEAERRVYADRATHLGDTDFYNVPIEGMLEKSYNHSRMQTFNPDVATKSSDIAAGVPPIKESEQTTHYSIIDAYGNAVSVTTTINTGYGSKVVVGGAGFFLNNEMDDFSAKAGVPNFFGLVGNEANSIQPGKRMLSSMTPTIVTQGDNLKMVVGTPGGSTIITSVFQAIVNVIDFNMSANDAVQSPRFHHQWLPDAIMYEPDCMNPMVIEKLAAMGHTMMDRSKPNGGDGYIGRVEVILVTKNGKLEVAADKRGDDTAMGY